MLAGTKDGKDWGFYFDEQKESLKTYFTLTKDEHSSLLEGQNNGKAIVFHEDRKPTLEDPPPPTEAERARWRIEELKEFLLKTDYAAIKIAEGAADAQEYEEVIARRRAARKEINELEKISSGSLESADAD